MTIYQDDGHDGVEMATPLQTMYQTWFDGDDNKKKNGNKNKRNHTHVQQYDREDELSIDIREMDRIQSQFNMRHMKEYAHMDNANNNNNNINAQK